MTSREPNESEVDDLENFRGRSRSRSFVADTEDVDVEMDDNPRGRSRSRSFVSESEDSVADEENDYPIQRRRSRSFISDDEAEGEDSGEIEGSDVAARAASMSKLLLAGGKPVGPEVRRKRKTGKRETKEQTGALSAKALDALSEGLQDSARVASKSSKPSEEEIEEEKLAEQEAELLNQEKSNKKAYSGASSRAMAIASKGAATLRSSIFSRKLGLGGGNTGNSSSASSAGSDTASRGSESSRATDEKISSTSSNAAAPARKASGPRKRHKLKLLLLGDSGVGKTSLMRVFSGDKFSESMLATAGVDFKLRNIEIAGQEVALQVWDTAGQERFHRITATYYKGADGIILVYDVNERQGFDNVGYWMNNIQQYSSPKVPAMLLVGNKIDLDNRMVSPEDGVGASSQYHCRFIETSAKTSQNTEEALETIARDALFLSINSNMTQKELIEKEKIYGRVRLMKEQCVVS